MARRDRGKGVAEVVLLSVEEFVAVGVVDSEAELEFVAAVEAGSRASEEGVLTLAESDAPKVVTALADGDAAPVAASLTFVRFAGLIVIKVTPLELSGSGQVKVTRTRMRAVTSTHGWSRGDHLILRT